MTVSLRTRLLLGVIVSTALLLCILCIILYAVTRDTLIRQFDDSLLSTAKILSAVIENEGFEEEDEDEDGNKENKHEEREHSEHGSDSEIEFEFDVRMTPEFNTLNGGGYYQFWNDDRTVTVRSPSLGGAELFYFGNELSTDTYKKHILPDGKPGRAVSYRFAPRTKEREHTPDGDFIIITARDASKLYDFLGFFRWLLLNSSLVTVFLSAFIAAKVSSIGLKPVYVLAKEIESVDETNLSQSFSTQAYPVDLAPLWDGLNELMERIKKSFDRERRFNSDVAHELRTPLAGIQSTIEVCLSRDRQTQEYADALKNCLTINKTMNRLVNTLLSLSRFESKQITFQTEKICIKELLDRTWVNFADKAHDKHLSYENLVDESLRCASDKDHLGMILSNIVDNAVEYCDNKGQIWINGQLSEDSVILTISNTGCTLEAGDNEKVFDFFWRADDARTDTGTHCGIGLAVVQKIASVLGIKVKAEIDEEAVFSIILELPKG